MKTAIAIKYFAIAALVVGCFLPELAFAGTSDVDGYTPDTASDEIFTPILEFLLGLAMGAGGKTIAILAFVIGAIASLARGSLMFLAMGGGFAIVLFFGPRLILGLFTGTI